jgi:hypothetical protein
LGTTTKQTNAEALFKKETRIREGEKSMADYVAERQTRTRQDSAASSVALGARSDSGTGFSKRVAATASKHFEGLSRQIGGM